MSTRGDVFVCVLGFLLSLSTVASGDQHTIQIPDQIPGTLEITPHGFSQERFTPPSSMIQTLLSAADRTPIVVESWPVAPGQRDRIIIERHSVIDPNANIVLVTSDGVRPLPPSSRVHFWGVLDHQKGRIMLSMDPADGTMTGFIVADGEVFEIGVAGSEQLVVRAEDRLAAEGISVEPWTCSLEDDPPQKGPEPPLRAGPGSSRGVESAGRSATIAFDTDTELLQLKFNNNQSAALDYIADLVAAMNVMYERDLDVTLLQGHTILRTGSDPYNQNSGGNASSAELNEFGSYWSSNYNHIDRALAAMLSGKQPSSNSASGIAWVGGLCSRNYGYSFTKVFKVDYLPGDAFVAGHELGHNFGSRHTHCYSPPIDHCYANEGGCYSGPTSCPGGPGTVMSYCHINGCGSNYLRFHSRVITNILSNHVNPAFGVCIFDAAEPVFSDGFESGDSDRWSSTSP
jgi:hypothetical protein